MRDPFLGDALDGFDAVPGDHSAALGRLAEGIRRSAVDGRAAARSQASRLRERRIRGWSIAAAAVFLAGIVGGGVLLLNDEVQSDTTRGTIAGRTDRSGYPSPEVEVILPPVTVIPNEPESASPPTETSDLRLNSEEVRDLSDAIAPAPSPAPQAQRQAEVNEPAREEQALPVQAEELEIAEMAEDIAPQASAEASDQAAIDEVIVVGYGVQKRSELTGSAAMKASRSDALITASEVSALPADTVTTAEFRRYIHERTIVRSAVLGAVVLGFDVDANGRPQNISIVDAPANFPEAADAAVELLKGGPDWPSEPARKLITINL